jgi:hypothetical protein
MPLEHPTDPPVVHLEVRRLPDNPGQLAIGTGMGDRPRHEGLLDVTRQEGFDGGLAPRMRQLALSDQPQEALTSKAAQGAPQPPIVEAGGATLRHERTLPRQEGADRFRMRESVLIHRSVTGEERSLRCANQVRGHRCLLPPQQRSLASN